MVIPADGPSFGTAPAGTWICISDSFKVSASSGNMDLTRVNAICTDSFITSPNWPVIWTFPSPFVLDVSINRISPPALVHASPVTTPACGSCIRTSWWIFLRPRNSFSRFTPTEMLFCSPFTSFTAAWRHSVSICFFSPRTPDSIVYSLIISRMASSVTFRFCFFNPMTDMAFGSRYFFAISNFSTAVYPGNEITSIRFNSGSGIVSVLFAVHTKNTFDRS